MPPECFVIWPTNADKMDEIEIEMGATTAICDADIVRKTRASSSRDKLGITIRIRMADSGNLLHLRRLFVRGSEH